MMRKTLNTLVFGFLFLMIPLVSADVDLTVNPDFTGTGESVITEPSLTPVISVVDFVALNKKVLFDASDSLLLPDSGDARYVWDFGDGTGEKEGKEIVYSFSEIGSYSVLLKVRQGDQEEEVRKNIFVYSKKAVLITDSALFKKEEGLEVDEEMGRQNLEIADQAAREGVWLTIMTIDEDETAFLASDKVVQKLIQKAELVKESDFLIFYTKSSLGLQGFARYWQELPDDEKFDLTNKLLLKITDESLPIAAQLAQQAFNVIKPKFILVTRKEAINPIFEVKNNVEIIQTLEGRAIEYKVVDQRSERSKFFVLSTILTGFIAQGIPPNAIYLILAFPFAAFFIAFARQFLGLSTFGVYTPLMLVISFLVLGVTLALIILFVVIASSYIVRKVFSKIELLYIPRISLMFSFISLSFLVAIWFILKFSNSVAVTLAIFPMLVMSTMSEKFVSAQSEEGISTALFSAVETIIISILAYYFLVWSSFADLLMSMPELILLPLVGNFILGKFTGLRLTEYFRFRMLLKENIEE